MKRFPKIYPVTSHTDHVGPGSTFVAIKGFKEDGCAYIVSALEKGASTIVVQKGVVLEESVRDAISKHGAALVRVESPRKALAQLSAQAYDYPSNGMKIIGITGTKGKTTTSYILEHILRSAGLKTALLGTVKNRILNTEYDAPLTTPQPDYLHTFFALCKEQSVEVVVMEIAAQALSMHRVEGILFDTVVFTNFSLEHSEFYQSLDDYFAAKCQIFSQLNADGLVVLNADDERVAATVPDWPLRQTISMLSRGTYNGTVKESSLSSLSVDISGPSESYQLMSDRLLGTFSCYNLLACSAVADRYGIEPTVIQKAVREFKGVPGRLNRYALSNGATAIIDMAHTPSSYEALFKALRPLSTHIIVVFGAGGDRDKSKRPLMGATAAQYADELILTTDNPRFEDVTSITDDIVRGIMHDKRNKVTIELDRERAIRIGYSRTKKGSLLVLLGKGPDEYQQVRGTKIPYNEAAVLRTLRS